MYGAATLKAQQSMQAGRFVAWQHQFILAADRRCRREAKWEYNTIWCFMGYFILTYQYEQCWDQ